MNGPCGYGGCTTPAEWWVRLEGDENPACGPHLAAVIRGAVGMPQFVVLGGLAHVPVVRAPSIPSDPNS